MNGMTRRQLLGRLAGLLATAGSVVVARTVLAEEAETPAPPPAAPDTRADQLAGEHSPSSEETEYTSFLNGAFRNGGGAFRNSSGFRNGAGGVGGGGFINGAFRNGGFVNGAFRNGGFRNGGFLNRR